jgi:hypothetical protein
MAIADAVKADAKKKAQAALKEAATQLEIAKLWQLCTGGSQQQQKMIQPLLQQQQKQQQVQQPSAQSSGPQPSVAEQLTPLLP